MSHNASPNLAPAVSPIAGYAALAFVAERQLAGHSR
jgi:hypothetical protein